MSKTWRLTNACGSGKGSNLTSAEVDQNFWELELAIAAVEQISPPDITKIVQDDDYRIRVTTSLEPYHGDTETGTQTGTDTEDYSYTYGPFTPPTVKFRFTSWYRADFDYQAFDIIQRYDGTVHSGLWLVTQEHTSAAVFDPYAETTEGPLYHKVYGESNIFDMGVYVPLEMGEAGSETGTIAQEVLFQIVAPRAFLVTEDTGTPAGYAYLREAPTEDLICSLQKNGAEGGGFTISAGQHTAEITVDSELYFAAGDVLSLVRETASGGRDLSATIRTVRQ